MTLAEIKNEYNVTFDTMLSQVGVIEMLSDKITRTYSLKEKNLSEMIDELKYEQRLLIDLNNHCKDLDAKLHESFTVSEASKLL